MNKGWIVSFRRYLFGVFYWDTVYMGTLGRTVSNKKVEATRFGNAEYAAYMGQKLLVLMRTRQEERFYAIRFDENSFKLEYYSPDGTPHEY